MRTTAKRVAVPFLFRADDALGAGGKLIARAYGAEVEGVFTRADAAWQATVQSTLYRMGRAAHSQPRLGAATIPGSVSNQVTDYPALTLEAGTTNLVTQSEDFSAWTNSAVTVTTNAVVAPDGTTTADLLDATSATTDERYLAVTFTGDGTKAVSVFLRANTATEATVILRDATAGVNRVRATVNMTTGSVSRAEGTGPVWSVPYEDAAGNTWIRVMLSVDGVVAANTNRFTIRPDTALGTGSVYAWGAQAENLAAPSSYVKTAGGTVARAADALAFPFALKPQALTFYVRGYDPGTQLLGTDPGIASIGGATNASFFIYSSGSARYTALNRQSSDVSSAAAAGTTPGQLVELRALLGATGTVTLGQALDAGTEAVASASAANALAAAWANAQLYIGSRNGNPAPFAFTHVCVSLGTKTMAEMRVLAEVG